MNCGIYAIAYAFHAANGDDLCLLSFEEEQMRTHLLQCYEVQCLKPFPITSDKVVRCRGKKMLVNLNANQTLIVCLSIIHYLYAFKCFPDVYNL